MKTEIKTRGMMCSGCENRMNKALLKVKGVQACSSDSKTGIVSIEHDASFDKKEAEEVIEDIGFDLV